MNENSKNRVILITGTSSGIGKACADHLHERGYRVYGTSRKIQQVNPKSFAMIQMDVDNDSSVEKGVNIVLEKEGHLDIVINNAGFGIAGSIEDTSIEEAKAQLETNFFGVFRVCKAVLPIMRKQESGYIINISSIGGLISVPFQGLYCASKFAVEGMSEALRMEIKEFGIKVILIEPGDFHTGFTLHRRRTLQSQENSVYSEKCNNTVAVMEKDEINGYDTEKVACLVERIINIKTPYFRYTTGPIIERIAVSLKKVLPHSIFERIVMMSYKL